MLLVIDVGNTNTIIGVYDGKTLKHDWRIRTIRDTTADEFNILANSLFADKSLERGKIKKTIILNRFCEKYLHMTPLFISADSVKKMMPILYDNPNEVGADRIVNAIAAYNKYKAAMIIIDFGTATTFDIISKKGEYLGGAIAPGVMISADALFQRASKLPRVEIFKVPGKIIGKDTIKSIKSGIIHGNAAMVDGMVERITKEMGTEPKVIATGGLAPLIAGASKTIQKTEPSLTLNGLKIISNFIENS